LSASSGSTYFNIRKSNFYKKQSYAILLSPHVKDAEYGNDALVVVVVVVVIFVNSRVLHVSCFR